MGRLARGFRSGARPEALDLDRRTARCWSERSSLELSALELYAQLLPASHHLEEARGEAASGRLGVAAVPLLEHFQIRLDPPFFLHPSEAPAVRAALEAHPADCRGWLEGALPLLERRLAPLGADPARFEANLDWFADFRGQSWVCAHVRDLREQFQGRQPYPAVDMGPIAVTWELNRHGHFSQMGRGYWLTGNERFASEWIVQLLDWIRSNPPLRGVNWLDPETVAARAVHWMLAMHFFLGSEQLAPELFVRILAGLMQHGSVLAHHLGEEGGQSLAAASGLYQLAWTFPEFRLSRRWLALAERSLPRCLEATLTREGLHRSASLARHRLACEWLILPLWLHRVRGVSLPTAWIGAADLALEALGHLRGPGGRVAELGGAASPGFLGIGCGPSEHARRILGLGGLATGRAELGDDLREVPGELLWWCGPRASERFQALGGGAPAARGRGFGAVGVAAIRDRWDPRASWLVFRGGPLSPPAEVEVLPPSEARVRGPHDDSLSLTLTLEGEPVLIDPGAPPEGSRLHGLLSRLACHSTIRVAGEPEPLLGEAGDLEPWSGGSRGTSGTEPVQAEEREGGFYLSAAREVVMPGQEPWALRRELMFQPARKALILRDRLEGAGEALVELNFLLAPQLELLMRGDMGCIVRGRRLHARIHPVFPVRFRYALERGQPSPLSGWHWSEGGRMAPASRLRYFARLVLPVTLHCWIGWDPGEGAAPRPRDLEGAFPSPSPAARLPDGVRGRGPRG